MAVSPVDIEILQDSALGAISNTYSTMSSDDFHDLHGIYEKIRMLDLTALTDMV